MAEEEFDRQLMCDEPEVVQTLIDISSDMLISLRNLCETRAELTQHEIRTLEVSHFNLCHIFWCFFYEWNYNFVIGQARQIVFSAIE